jgi:hypothetical protein
LVNDLQKVTISPYARSETRYLQSIIIGRDIHNIRGVYNDIILVDTPGTMDTHSSEVDISNGIGVLRGIHSCNSVRPLLLFSYLRLGAKGEDLKELINYYASML